MCVCVSVHVCGCIYIYVNMLCLYKTVSDTIRIYVHGTHVDIDKYYCWMSGSTVWQVNIWIRDGPLLNCRGIIKQNTKLKQLSRSLLFSNLNIFWSFFVFYLVVFLLSCGASVDYCSTIYEY